MELDFDLSEAPITNKFVSDMTNIIERINTDPEIIKLRQTNYKEFEDYVFNIEEFKPFIEEYNLIKKADTQNLGTSLVLIYINHSAMNVY